MFADDVTILDDWLGIVPMHQCELDTFEFVDDIGPYLFLEEVERAIAESMGYRLDCHSLYDIERQLVVVKTLVIDNVGEPMNRVEREFHGLFIAWWELALTV